MCGLAACSYRDSTVSCCELYVLPIVIMTALVLGYELYVLPVVITTSLCGKWFLYLGGDFSSFDKIYLAMPMGLELKHRKCYGLTLNPVFFPLGVPRPRILEVCVMMPVAQGEGPIPWLPSTMILPRPVKGDTCQERRSHGPKQRARAHAPLPPVG